jgi:cytidylate kinase
MSKKSVTVAIDGPAAAGKSTIGKGVARALRCRYLDTGLMYRAVTFLALESGTDLSDGAALQTLTENTVFDLTAVPGEYLLVNGTAMRGQLRRPEVDGAVSQVSAHPEVRAVLVARQRELAAHGCIVMVGRDIGTVVLPTASVKLWVTASPRTRALRRNRERDGQHLEEMVQREMARILERDRVDSGRAVSPLRQAADAIVVETDGISPDVAIARAVAVVRGALHPEADPSPTE